MVDSENLFEEIPEVLEEELLEPLVETAGFRLERIVSRGHRTPDGQWCEQQRNEWVVLLRGAAILQIAGKETPIRMEPGDFVKLPAGLRHRVEWTDPSCDSVWLALHW